MVEKKVFVKVCEAFAENLALYKEVDTMLEHSYRAREYYKKAVKPVMRVFAREIAGQEALDVVIFEDDWGKDFVYDMVMRVIEDFFDNDAQTVLVRSSQSAKGQCYVPFGQVYNAEVIYEWLYGMQHDQPETLNLPVGPVESGYDVIKHYVAQGIEF